MGKTTLTLKQDYFTSEVTEAFIVDFEEACLTMELSNFTYLFAKYDLEFIDGFREVFDLIAEVMSSWKNPGEETKLLNVTQEDSKCSFCNIGKSVRVYRWTYQHSASISPMNKVVYKSKIGFYLEYDNNQLIEFGVCNAYK